MPWVGFEPKIPAFERAKTVHALDRSTTVIENLELLCLIIRVQNKNKTNSLACSPQAIYTGIGEVSANFWG
jgi:hypothetical protein